MNGWGFGPWGSSPWGSGVAAPQLLSAFALRENCVRLTFSVAIRYDRTGAPRDGSRPSLYAVTPAPGTRGFDGEAARAVTVGRVDAAGGAGTVLDLWLDRPLTHWSARYLATASGVYSSGGVAIDAGSTAAAFDGVRAGRPTRDPAAGSLLIGADLALPESTAALLAARSGASPLGAFAVDETGDYAADRGLQSLVKRVRRRLFAEPGAYAHLGAGYGAGLRGRVKRLGSASERAALQAACARQAEREPEVAKAEALLTPIAGASGAWRLTVRIRTRFGQDVAFEEPLRVDG